MKSNEQSVKYRYNVIMKTQHDCLQNCTGWVSKIICKEDLLQVGHHFINSRLFPSKPIIGCSWSIFVSNLLYIRQQLFYPCNILDIIELFAVKQNWDIWRGTFFLWNLSHQLHSSPSQASKHDRLSFQGHLYFRCGYSE